MAKDDGDGFIERWSRRKRGEAAPDAPITETETETVAVLAPTEEDPDAGDPEVIAKLPDLDSLTEESDFTAFLQDGVPEALRRRALRRLWRLNPVFANLDGLNDYDEDYSAGGIIAENIKTIYKVGKGYLDDDEPETEGETETEEGPETEDRPETEEGPETEDRPGDGDAVAAVDSEVPNPGDPEPSAEGKPEAKSEKPAPGSALARRWGGSPNQG